MAREDHERVLWAVIGAGGPDQEPRSSAFLEVGGGCLCTGGRGQRLAAPGLAHHPRPLALPPGETAAAAAPAPTQTEAQVTAQPEGDGTGALGGWRRVAWSLARRLAGRASDP